MNINYLVFWCMNLALTVRELHGFITIDIDTNHRSIRKQVLFDAICKDVLDRLIRERDFFRSINVMLLDLLTEITSGNNVIYTHALSYATHCSHRVGMVERARVKVEIGKR